METVGVEAEHPVRPLLLRQKGNCELLDSPKGQMLGCWERCLGSFAPAGKFGRLLRLWER